MRLLGIGCGLLGLALALGATAPASAEMFTCHQRPGQLLYSYSGSASQYGNRSSISRSTSNFSVSSQRQYQAHASYTGSRHYWTDRSRW